MFTDAQLYNYEHILNEHVRKNEKILPINIIYSIRTYKNKLFSQYFEIIINTITYQQINFHHYKTISRVHYTNHIYAIR